ncbi:MAG: PhzF family phenazine biosynthesis protein [Bacteroidota bacterium]
MNAPDLFRVNAFTDRPFGGNPAAVCLPEKIVSTEYLQAMATDINLSETAFLWPIEEGFRLRWFTPKHEVDLCGHATLASAKVLWETGRCEQDQVIRFSTKSGWLEARQEAGRIRLDFPEEHVSAIPIPEWVTQAFPGEELVYVGKNRMDFLVEIKGESNVRSMTPAHEVLATVPSRGIIVTAQAETEGLDFVSRFFAPAHGIEEDPVTGSAHCALAPYWQEKLGKNPMEAFQASDRGGYLRVEVKGNRVLLGGNAVLTAQGNWVWGD